MVAVAYVNKPNHVVFSEPECMLAFAWQTADDFLIES